MIKELFKDSAKYLPSMIVPALMVIIALPICTRLFSPGDYGDYALVIATVTLLSNISISWLSSSTIRFFPTYKLNNELGEFYSTLFKLAFISVVCTVAAFLSILFLARTFISGNLYSLMRVGILLFIANSFFRIFLDLLRANRRVSLYTNFSIWYSITGLGFGMVLVLFFHFGIVGLLLGSLISITAIFPLLLKFSIGKPSLSEGSIHSSMTGEMVEYGMPAMVINLLTWILTISGIYVLGFFRGSQEVGIYSASNVISQQSIFLIVSLFSMASIPIAFGIWESQGIKASQEFMSKLGRYYLIIALPAAVGLSVLAKPIVGVLFPPDYFLGYRIVPMISVGAFLVGVSNIFSEGLTFHKRTDLLMFCYLGAGLLNIGLNFVFIPRYGYIGAAVATLSSYAFLLLLTINISRRFFIWEFPFKSFLKVAFSSAVMGIIVYPVGNSLTSSTLINLISGVCIGVVSYALMLLLLNELLKEETNEILSITRKILARKSLRMVEK